MTHSILIQQHYLTLSPHTHTQKTTLPNKTFWNKYVTNNNNSRGCLQTPSCTITHLPVPRTFREGKWAKKSDCLVSFGNTSQHSTRHRSELHSENKHFKSCWPVVWPTDLTKHEFRLFTTRHNDVVISASFWPIYYIQTTEKYLRFGLFAVAKVVTINLKPCDRTHVSNVTSVLFSVSQTVVLYLL